MVPNGISGGSRSICMFPRSWGVNRHEFFIKSHFAVGLYHISPPTLQEFRALLSSFMRVLLWSAPTTMSLPAMCQAPWSRVYRGFMLKQVTALDRSRVPKVGLKLLGIIDLQGLSLEERATNLKGVVPKVMLSLSLESAPRGDMARAPQPRRLMILPILGLIM